MLDIFNMCIIGFNKYWLKLYLSFSSEINSDKIIPPIYERNIDNILNNKLIQYHFETGIKNIADNVDIIIMKLSETLFKFSIIDFLPIFFNFFHILLYKSFYQL